MKQRKWIDLLLFYSTVIIIISGIVLYIMPHGRVAYFTGWNLVGLDKDNWGNIHIVFGLLMSIVIIWHIVLNWKLMKKYLFTKESLFSLIIISFITAGTILNIQPFKSISDLENYIKNSWEVSKVDIPVAHGELMTLNEFCNKLNIPINKAINNLNKAKIIFQENRSLKDIANLNKVTPNKIYQIIKQPSNMGNGTGLGRKTLSEVCQKNSVSVNKCIQILKKHNIKAKPNQILKEIAFPNNLTPMDIIDMIKK